jgi:TctA family transporter
VRNAAITEAYAFGNSRIGRPLQPIAVLVDVADDDVRCIMKWTIIWALIVGAVVALILVITAVSMSASGFQLDVERWVLIGAFLVVISMGTAVMVSVLNTLKDVRQHTARNTTGYGNGDDKSGNPS